MRAMDDGAVGGAFGGAVGMGESPSSAWSSQLTWTR
jgi:hypothetical protein